MTVPFSTVFVSFDIWHKSLKLGPANQNFKRNKNLMKILIALTLAAFSSAIRINDEVVRYSSQEECDAIPVLHYEFSHKFNKDACTCFFTWTTGSHYCEPEQKLNPLYVPFNSLDLCINDEEYYAIFDHELDANCQPKE